MNDNAHPIREERWFLNRRLLLQFVAPRFKVKEAFGNEGEGSPFSPTNERMYLQSVIWSE